MTSSDGDGDEDDDNDDDDYDDWDVDDDDCLFSWPRSASLALRGRPAGTPCLTRRGARSAHL